MTTQLIITHPGSAHFDEVTAIGLIMAVNAENDYTIERREPGLVELDDPDVWVIDIGNRYEPAKHNFDHHQDPDCSASFVLVADHLDILETLRAMPWWNFKDSVDRVGPVVSSLKYQAGDDLVNRNPIEDWLIDFFSSRPETSLSLLKDFGTHLIADARMLKSQIDYWKTCPRLEISGVPAMIGETEESAGLEEFRRLDESPPDIVISRDRRGKGWRLFRFDGTQVDFSRISGRLEIEFAHNSGFMAKTRELLAIDDLIELVSKAVISSQ